jgi:ATP-dependent phosphoenolpyruvate carboxykinase
VGPAGDVAIFFGLSGTGKTTLSADPARGLIGDDEHGWSDAGVFNFEGGCYAKVIHLSREGEPEIWTATRMFGTILENVVLDQATFSACFGAPFLPLHPGVYARMLGERIARHGVACWLVNTGWTGGPHGEGHRMQLTHTRAMVRAALDGGLAAAPTREDPVFGLAVPTAVPDVPAGVLDPRSTWADGARFDAQAKKLAEMFRENFRRFADGVSDAVRRAGPRA